VSERVCELQASTHSFTHSTSQEGGHDQRPQHWIEQALRTFFAAQAFSCAAADATHANASTPAASAVRRT
jgi:hypothetical protein